MTSASEQTSASNYKCMTCGTDINEGEYETFGVCDACYDKHRGSSPASPQPQPDTLRLDVDLIGNKAPNAITLISGGEVHEFVRQPDELSKAQERERWREIAVDGLPGEEYYGKWVELLKFKPIYSQPPVLFFRQWFDIDDPARYTLSKIYTHWREIQLPS